MSDLDLHSLRIVRAIADTGSITAAARALGFSQPAVSQHLQRVEIRLGVPLITRVGRGVRLTEAGAVLARHAVTVTTALDAASGELAELAGLQSGSVRVAAFPTASSTLVPRLFAAMRERHPGITVGYVEAEPPEAETLLRDGAVDLAITFSYAGDGSSVGTGLTSTTLFTERTVVVLPATHALAGASTAPVDLADLAAERWIAGCPRCRGHLLTVCATAGFEPAISLETDNAAAVLSMVASGLGVAMLPRLALATATIPAGVVIREHTPESIRSIHLLTNDGGRRVPSIAATSAALAALDGADFGLDHA
ncbi:LysR family transcriptional regulator [Glaciihabitans sp. dw_435]|uniref:LysR family transcriptional regulator n=1 Tax=Glaciihabitans sp. dw_435 TaxID=2720081 RepID=UPI001BD5AD2F|nr:LysR family transcriptional regulator [Glaciihabitans sp. dw_435]